MKSIFLFLLLGLLGLSLAGCTKAGKNITVTGRVINPDTQQGVPGATVVISNDPELPLYWMLSKRTKQTKTASDGSFEINALRLKKYYVFADAPEGYTALGWYENGSYSESKTVTKGKKMTLEYHMTQ